LQLPQVAPGRYATEFTPDEEGAYLIRVTGEDGGEETAVAHTGGWVLGYSPEYEQRDASPRLLARAAEITDGRELETAAPEAAFSHTLPSEADTRPIWPWLTLLAVALLPLDVAARRLVVTRRDLERLWAATGGRWRQQPAPVPAAQAEQVSRLFAAKKRAERRRREETLSPATDATDAADAPPPTAPAPPPSSPQQERSKGRERPSPPPEAGKSLASRLLQKRRQQEDDANHDEEK
jgi:hypothetical protein